MGGMENGGLGAFVRARRQRLGLTTVALADLAGISQPYLSNIERGKNRLPSEAVRRRLAAVLGTTNLEMLVAAGEVTQEDLAGLPSSAPPAPPPTLPSDVLVMAHLVRMLTSEDRRAVVALLERLVGAREENRAYAAASPAPASEPVGSASG